MSRKYLFATIVLAVVAASGCRDRSMPQTQEAPVSAGVAETPALGGGETAAAKAGVFELATLEAAQWTGKPCNLDMVDRASPDATLVAGQSHQFEGFLVGPDGGPGGEFHMVFKGSSSAFAVSSVTGVQRPDVVDYFKDPALAAAGFAFSTDLSGVPAGEYQPVLVIERDGATFFCETGRHIVLQ